MPSPTTYAQAAALRRVRRTRNRQSRRAWLVKAHGWGWHAGTNYGVIILAATQERAASHLTHARFVIDNIAAGEPVEELE